MTYTSGSYAERQDPQGLGLKDDRACPQGRPNPSSVSIEEVVERLRSLRQSHEFTRDRIGQPGCKVREIAGEHVKTIDLAIASLTTRSLKEAEIVERCARIAEQYKALGYMSDRERDYCHEHGEEIATALRTSSPAGDGVTIPRAIAEQVLSMGRVEWGATAELTEIGHVAHLTETLRLTRKQFDCEDVPVPMHGLYLEGMETVLCHTGTSPNSGANAQALAGAWNWLFDQCSRLPSPPEGSAEA